MFRLDRVFLIVIEHVWISKLLRCETSVKIATREGCRVGQKWVITLVFANWTVLALEETFLSMCQSSRAIIFASIANLSDRCFCYFTRPPCLCPSEGHKHGFSIQSPINLGHTLLQITREWKTAETWFLVRLFIYQPSIVSQILDGFFSLNGYNF